MEILVARYQAQEKYLLRQIAWKFLLRVIKPRKILALKNSVEILVARYQAQEKITVNKIAWKFVVLTVPRHSTDLITLHLNLFGNLGDVEQ